MVEVTQVAALEDAVLVDPELHGRRLQRVITRGATAVRVDRHALVDRNRVGETGLLFEGQVHDEVQVAAQVQREAPLQARRRLGQRV